ncbi:MULTISPECIES: M50 family metallopeptidase [Bacillaceae]|uniref:M50 family metallopeptidase n=1 Tax=Evansella alkalicola TaxID=745819 RepID=A0ABS6JTI5_9BACI|nr:MULTISPECIES: M50 family metallopeptidase [Bacillaceae]MBU9721898.1 M50 family metallopeptidase [Bacillus alkalicola]
MINLLKKVHIHPIFWAILGAGAISGFFKEIIMLFIIVFVHEMGHSMMAQRFRWRIKKITLLPFGGMAETEEYGNRPVREEILVVLNGPVQHLWLMGVSYFLLLTPFWSEGDHQMFIFHNLTILLFNLLPVLPLDGGKLLFAFHSYIFPFHKAQQISFYMSISLLSIMSVIGLIFLPFHLNLIVVIIFLWIHHYLEWKQQPFMFLRFLLERKRYLMKGSTDIIRVSPTISVAEAMKKVNRQRYHYFILGNNNFRLEEKQVLEAFFDEEKRLHPISKLV